jgi:hypothetical protein
MSMEMSADERKAPPAGMHFAPGSERPPLKTLVIEASQALARLDAGRLEELALSCEALIGDMAPADSETLDDLARQANEAETGMAVFARILEATRANLNVMQRLRELRASRLEYGELPGGGWVRTESGHGDN